MDAALALVYAPQEEEKMNNMFRHLLPIKNGKVVNLRTGQVEPRLKEHMFSTECAWSLVHDTSKAEKFMLDVFNGDVRMIRHFQKMLGYCLTGELSERKLFLLVNAGAGAKSTIMAIFKAVLGNRPLATSLKQ